MILRGLQHTPSVNRLHRSSTTISRKIELSLDRVQYLEFSGTVELLHVFSVPLGNVTNVNNSNIGRLEDG